jgi:uncharacterized protein
LLNENNMPTAGSRSFSINDQKSNNQQLKDVTMDSQQEVIQAIKSGDASKLRAILDNDATAASAGDANGVSALMLALYFRQHGMVEMLNRAHPDLDIFEASSLGKADRVHDLINRDRSLASAWSPDGFTPLHFAGFFGQEDSARTLLENGADPNAVAKNTMKVAPLHSAAAGRNVNIVRMLLERGASPNARQHGGWTPIHEAAQSGDFDMVELLLKHGADPAAKNDAGVTALDLAKQKGHADLAERLSAA